MWVLFDFCELVRVGFLVLIFIYFVVVVVCGGFWWHSSFSDFLLFCEFCCCV